MIVFCPLCKEELVERELEDGLYSRFKEVSRCKNGHEFKVFLVAGHLSIGGKYYQSSEDTNNSRRVEK